MDVDASLASKAWEIDSVVAGRNDGTGDGDDDDIVEFLITRRK